MTKLNATIRIVLCAAAVLFMAATARADISGTVWFVPHPAYGTNQMFHAESDATPANIALGIKKATFNVTKIDFDSNGNLTFGLDDFLLSSGATNIVHFNGATGLEPLNDEPPGGGGGTYSSIFQFTGLGWFTAGQTYTITHDDGVQLRIDGAPVPGLTATPTSVVPESFVFGGSTGVHSFDLIYAECCVYPAELKTDIGAVPEPTSIVLLGSVLLGVGVLSRRRLQKKS